jgi:hypothetical protein
MGKHLLAKVHIVKLNQFTVSDVTELTSSTLDETAWAILKEQATQGIPIVCSQRKIKFPIQVLSILTELTDKTLQTGSKGLSNCRISPRHLESISQVRLRVGTYSFKPNIIHRVTTVIQRITKQVGVTVSQHPV